MLSARALSEWVAVRRLPGYRYEQILRWVYQGDAVTFASMSNVGRNLQTVLARHFTIPHLSASTVEHSADGTRKFLFELEAGRVIETVLIPDVPRITLCLSSQAGCGMGCRFCATAQIGWKRNLTSSEIVGQVQAARRTLSRDERLTNVVFMGMGEPLANYEAVVEAIEILVAKWGFGIGGRRITVSTVGLVPQLRRLVQDTGVNVAVSLIATEDKTRNWLMPVNRKYPLEQLLATCRTLPMGQRHRIMFEYVLLAGVNDSPADAVRLIRLLHGIRSKVNLIPFNWFPGATFRAPITATVRYFREQLLLAGIRTTVRQHRGRDIQAACGQLAGARYEQDSMNVIR